MRATCTQQFGITKSKTALTLPVRAVSFITKLYFPDKEDVEFQWFKS